MRLIIAILFLFITVDAAARDPKQVYEFRKTHPCPATRKITLGSTATSRACPGWVVDHVWSLCLGGPDEPRNMKWQEQKESYIKDKYEHEMCRMRDKILAADRDAVPLELK